MVFQDMILTWDHHKKPRCGGRKCNFLYPKQALIPWKTRFDLRHFGENQAKSTKTKLIIALRILTLKKYMN